MKNVWGNPERDRLEVERDVEPVLSNNHKRVSDAGDEGLLVSSIGRANRDESSSLRVDVSQLVKDEFTHMKSEWRAFRRARHEIRDEVFLNSLIND